MSDTEQYHQIKQPYEPICYIEGVRFPIQSGSVTSVPNKTVEIQIMVQYDPALWPSYIKVAETEDGGTHENGLEILYDVDAHGIPEQTVVQIWACNISSGLETFMAEGFVKQVTKLMRDGKLVLEIKAKGAGVFMEEINLQMADRRRALQVKRDWENQLGVSNVSTLAETVQSKGLRKGLIGILDDAGNKTDLYHNLKWRLHHLFHRIQVINNSKALGYFEGSRMSTIFDKSIGKIEADAPLSHFVAQVLQTVQYQQIGVLCPSFLNANYSVMPDQGELYNESDLTVDENSETVDYDIESEAAEKYHLKMNELLFLPDMFLSPPPRCNVLFPTQYRDLNDSLSGPATPTRGIVNVTGRGSLTGGVEEDALIMPEEVRQGITSGGKYYISPQERATGIKWSKFNMKRPQAAEDLGSDYVRGYMETAYAQHQFMGHKITLNGTCFNPKPIMGLPMLVISADGNHVIAELKGLKHSMQADRIITNYQFGKVRRYDEIVPEAPMNYWYEHDMFSQDNVGAYIYPQVIGRYYESGANRVVDDSLADMSILVHLYNDPSMEVITMTAGEARERGEPVPDGMPDDARYEIQVVTADSPEAMEAAYEAEDATKKAVDNLFQLWKDSPNRTWFEEQYGSRMPISVKHLYSDFYRCQHSGDWFLVGNGYTLATNSVTTISGDDEEEEERVAEEDDEYGEKLPRDAILSGCFMKERQDNLIQPAIRNYHAVSIPVELTSAVEEEDLQEADITNMTEGMARDG